MKFPVNVDNGLFTLNGQRTSLDHQAKIIQVTIQQGDSRRLCHLANQSLLRSVRGLRSLSALLQFLGGAQCFAVQRWQSLCKPPISSADLKEWTWHKRWVGDLHGRERHAVWFNLFSVYFINFSCPPLWLRLCSGPKQFWVNHKN